ncbi:hypothetical protein JCM3770_000464 [Rhodotorula araucariae]
MPTRRHPYGHKGSATLPEVAELRDRLTTRLTYAHFKLTHDRIAHSLAELENLYLRPFRAQADARAAARRNDPRRHRWRDEAIRADEARERGDPHSLKEHVEPVLEPRPDRGAKPSAVKLGKRKAVDQDPPPVSRKPPAASTTERKAPNFMMRFQGLPSTLDMNAVVRQQAHITPASAPSPAPAPPSTRSSAPAEVSTSAYNSASARETNLNRVEEDDEDVPMLPEAAGGRRRAETRTSSASSYLDPVDWGIAGPANGTIQHDPDRLQSLRRTTSEVLSPQESHTLPRQGSSTSLHTNGSSAASLILRAGYAPPPPSGSSASSAPLLPPVDAAPSLYSGPAEAVPSPYSARSTAAFSDTTLAPASSASALRPPPITHDPPLAPRAHSFRTAPFAPHSDTSASLQPSPRGSSQASTAQSARSGTSATSQAGGGPPSARALGSQPSFSALPPVPPLPFDHPLPLASASAWGSGSHSHAVVPPSSSAGTAVAAASQASWVGRLSGGTVGEVVRAAAAEVALDSDDDGVGGAFDEDEDDQRDGHKGALLPLRVHRADAEGSRPPSPSGSDDEAGDDADALQYPPLSQDTLVDSQESFVAGAGGFETQETQGLQVSDGGALGPPFGS